MILSFLMQRHSGLTVGIETRVLLCQKHLEIRKTLGWVVLSERKAMSERPPCQDCEVAGQPTIMDRAIEAEDAAAKADEPTPVKVLKGQEKLF